MCFGIRNYGESSSFVITNDIIVLSDRIVCGLCDGVGVSLSIGVAIEMVLFDPTKNILASSVFKV
jgi:hypothetical protein